MKGFELLSIHTTHALWLAALVIGLSLSAGAAQSTLEKAFALEEQGKLDEARNLYRQAADEYRASGDKSNLAAALSHAGSVSVLLGDYSGAIRDAEEAIKLRQASGNNDGLNADFNTDARAYQYLGNYSAALDRYQEALKVDRLLKDSPSEIVHLNNIGNIHFFQGRYSAALESYQSALQRVNANTTHYGFGLTTANIAILDQKLGLDEQALALYQQISGRPDEMPANEYAQILSSEGALYRRLGDPVKALELYHTAQTLYRTVRLSDGEIGVLRNIGIAQAMDLNDLEGALKTFAAALALSQKSSNNRNIVLANLYMGEVLRRLGQLKDAGRHLHAALEQAQKAGLVEEQWKALFALGKISEQTDSAQTALEDYRKAIEIIESVRAGLRLTSLRTDFLADKRDVYDSLIALQLQQPVPAVDELFHWMERSRARTLMDRVTEKNRLTEATLQSVQSKLPPETVLVEFWVGNQDSAAVWINAAGSGIVRYKSADDIRASGENLLAAIQAFGDAWKEFSRELGNRILAGVPLQRHLIIVPDGPLNVPFEALGVPGKDALLIEQSDVSYLPSAQFLAVTGGAVPKALFPWKKELVAMGDPPVSSADSLVQREQWQPLPASADEVRGIAKIIPGRAEIHLGTDARKSHLLDHHLEGLPLLHLSTHALIDSEHPERSRILLASDSATTADYLFLEEVNNLDLQNVGMVTVSACDTARGKLVRGEGIQAFSQAFLGAGASATLTSMWKVADGPTANFMDQVYDSLSRGLSRAEAVQEAKLRFLRSNSEYSSPRHWAAFILNGAGWNPTTPVIRWSTILIALAAVLLGTSLSLWGMIALRAARKPGRKALPSP